jgi:Mg2+ and Co2+ transporter CorA
MTVLTNIRKMLNSFYHLSYDEFVEDLQALIQDCDRYKRKAIVAQNENKFVLARLGKLREEIIRQSTGFGTNSDLARRSARTKADAGAGLGMSVVAGAGLGFLVGGPIGALAVGSVLSSSSMLLLQSSSLDMSYAADWNSAAMATAALLDSLTKVDGIVDSIAKFLGMMASELEDIETAGKNQIDARRYLRYFQRKHDEAVGMCDAFMKTQSALQSAFEDEADEVDNWLRLEWLRERRNVVGY